MNPNDTDDFLLPPVAPLTPNVAGFKLKCLTNYGLGMIFCPHIHVTLRMNVNNLDDLLPVELGSSSGQNVIPRIKDEVQPHPVVSETCFLFKTN